jgi:prophage regulatory protein
MEMTMTRNADRLHILMAPYDDGKPTELPEHAGPPTVLTGLPRTIRRHELRLVVPLSDTTIYEMEVRGEFPRRFYLTPRSVAWDLGEVEAWLRQRRADSDAGRIRKAPSPDVHLRKTRPVKEY